MLVPLVLILLFADGGDDVSAAGIEDESDVKLADTRIDCVAGEQRGLLSMRYRVPEGLGEATAVTEVYVNGVEADAISTGSTSHVMLWNGDYRVVVCASSGNARLCGPLVNAVVTCH
jgi:hypothetical protein